MRTAYISETYPPEINGVSLTVARTVGYLRTRGHQVELIRPCQPGEVRGGDAGEWRSAGDPLAIYPDLRFGIGRPCTLAHRFAGLGTELVHVATEGPLGWAAVVAANRLGLPTTSDFRTNVHQYSAYYGAAWLEPLIGAYLRWFHNQTQRCFSPTRETRRMLIDRLREGTPGVEKGGVSEGSIQHVLLRSAAPVPPCAIKKFPDQENRFRFVRFPKRIYPAMAPLIFWEKLFRQTEPLL